MAILVLSGCAGPQSNEPLATPSTSDLPTGNTMTPTSTSPVLNLDDPRSWLVDFAGIGPLALGDRVSEREESMTSFTTTRQDACPWVTAFDKSGFPSIWIPDPSDSGIVEQIVLQKWGSPQDVAANSPHTSTGIKIGATLDQLRAAYPALAQNEGKYAPYYSVTNGSGKWINFAVNDGGLVSTIVVRASPNMDSEYCG
jgi:hypothetical protein